MIGIGGEKTMPFNWVTNVDDHLLRDFGKFDGNNPATNYRISADVLSTDGTVVFEEQYDRARQTVRDSVYIDFCEAHDIPMGCQARLISTQRDLIGLALLRSRRDGPTTEAHRATFLEASVAARTAVRMQTAIEQQGTLLLAGAFDAMSVACFLLDASGRVSAMSPVAEDALRAGPLRLEDGRLSATTAVDRRSIAAATTRILAPAPGAAHARILLSCVPADAGGAFPSRIDCFRLHRREWSLGFQPSAMVVVRSRLSGADDHLLLGPAFGLTPAESAIAGLLWRGMDRPAIAALRGVAIETLRAQIKSLFAKMGCRREGELIVLLQQILG